MNVYQPKDDAAKLREDTDTRKDQPKDDAAKLRPARTVQAIDAVTDGVLDGIDAYLADLLRRHFPDRIGTPYQGALERLAKGFVTAEASTRKDADWRFFFDGEAHAALRSKLDAAALVAFPAPTFDRRDGHTDTEPLSHTERVEVAFNNRVRAAVASWAFDAILTAALATGEPPDAVAFVATPEEQALIEAGHFRQVLATRLAAKQAEAKAIREDLLAERDRRGSDPR